METTVISNLNKVLGNALEFLPDYDMHFDDNSSADVVESKLQFYRAGRKFNIPTAENEDEMHDASWLECQQTERRIDDLFSSSVTTEWISREASLLRRIRLEISRILANFSIDWSQDPGFGPGEQFISSGGKTSEFDKLAEHCWTCTEGSFPWFARAMYANRSTRRIVWKRCDRRLPLDPVMLKRPEYRFAYFTEHLRMVTTFVRGNRYSSVPKDNDKRRGICVEPLGNLYCQKAVGTALKQSLNLAGNDTWNGQNDHAALIASAVSTIDFSSASDSIHLGWIKLLFPPWFVSMIEAMRSPTTLHDGCYFRQNKVSSMGNGFTFELMTLLLLATCRAVGDKSARVYGDDVIIQNPLARTFINAAEHLGFQVNLSKSFVALKFRESCGAFFYERYLRSYELKYITNALEARATLNKIYLLGLTNYWFRDLWCKMIIHVPIDARGMVPDEGSRADNLGAYYWCDDHPLIANGASRWIESAYQRPLSSISKVTTVQPVVAKLRIEDTSVHRLVKTSLRLKHAIEPIRSLRQDSAEVTLQRITIYVDNQGFLMTSQRYKQLRAGETEYLQSTFEGEVLRREHWAAWHLD